MGKSITVAKFGSELIVNDYGIDQDAINSYAEGLGRYHEVTNLIIVTSGAVAAGRSREQQRGIDIDTYSDATLAQLGAISVMAAWEEAFSRQGISAGGLFVTHHELEDTKEGNSFVRALDDAGGRDVVSLVNANDALSNDELMELACGGDNDGLAAHIATIVGAKYLNIYTKKGGLVDDLGNRIPVVDLSNIEEVEAMLKNRKVKKDQRGNGKGGFAKKIKAGWRASANGTVTHITSVSEHMTWENSTQIIGSEKKRRFWYNIRERVRRLRRAPIKWQLNK